MGRQKFAELRSRRRLAETADQLTLMIDNADAWATEKQPYAIVAADGQPLAMAGLWERWRDRAAGDVLQSFTIMTTVPNELCAAIHDRMPVILPREKWAT
jgi:putative SOS response-associated peptidase YedK